MQVDTASGLLDSARQESSPHCDERPAQHDINLIIIHGISLPPGNFGGNWIDDLFKGRLDPGAHPYFQDIASLKVSAHLLIRRNGEVVQYVPFDKRAWHAGESAFDGRSCCNDYSIGIELEGDDDTQYETIQYSRLAEVVRCLMAAYPDISAERIVGHCDVAPGRKTDPGSAFDWSTLYKLIKA